MEERNIYKDLLDNIAEGVYFVNVNRKITYWNKAAEKISGYSESDVIDCHCSDNILVHVDSDGKNLCVDGCPLLNTINDGNIRTREIYMHHKDGHRIPVHISVSPIYSPEGTIIGAIELFRDNSAHIKDTETIKELKKAALYDTLTGIGNRRYIDMQLETSFSQYTRHDIPFGVLLIDIDGFKMVNDTYGHDIGDKVLKVVATTIKNNIRISDVVGRWGGEEFLCVVQYVDKQNFITLAEKLRMLIEKSFIEVSKQLIHVTVTIGAAYIESSDTPESIVKRADDYLYKGKTAGKNKVMSS